MDENQSSLVVGRKRRKKKTARTLTLGTEDEDPDSGGKSFSCERDEAGGSSFPDPPRSSFFVAEGRTAFVSTGPLDIFIALLR